MTSRMFSGANRQKIEKNVIRLLNGSQLMNHNTINSPRAVGDAVQGFLEEHISQCLPEKLVSKINTSFARRSMADLAFEDMSGNYYVVDIKTHNLDTKFNMPNLTSVERLARLQFTECLCIPIEYFDWQCLTLGALGWGQIQIADSNNVHVNTKNTRKKWMLQLCDALDLFYPNEIAKITRRIDYFRNIRAYWENQPD